MLSNAGAARDAKKRLISMERRAGKAQELLEQIRELDEHFLLTPQTCAAFDGVAMQLDDAEAAR